MIRLLSLLSVLTLVTGCATGENRAPRCMPKVGDTTADLKACGCRLYAEGGGAALPVSRGAGQRSTQTVIIVNYICPLGEAGIALATVVNGRVEQVRY
jgi:hypothetical protein